MVREDDIEDYLVDRIEAIGGMAEKFTSPGRTKVPDRLVTVYNDMFFVECKSPDTIDHFPSNAHERAQLRDHNRRRALGQRVYVIGTKEQVDQLIEELRDGRN